MTTQREVKTLEKLDEEINQATPNDPIKLLSFFQEFKNAIELVEKDFTRNEIISRIPGIRDIAGHSPLINRAQQWPKGYQGDFETILHILSQKNKAIPDTIGYAMEDFFLCSSICVQHANKIRRQAELILSVLMRNPYARILSIGCGASEDLKINMEEITKSKAEITLVDIDMDALTYSLNVLEKINKHIKIIHGNIYRIIKTLKEKFDLVIIGGVFDYLSDKVIISILSSLKENMNKEGIIFFTNIKQGNPFRIYMEYLSDWILIERSDSAIRDLLKQSGCDNFHSSILTDETNLTYLVEINIG